MNKFDWKLAVVLATHILVVGAMYGRITTEVAATQESIKSMKAIVEASSVQVTTLVEGRKSDSEVYRDIKDRVIRLEESTWKLK